VPAVLEREADVASAKADEAKRPAGLLDREDLDRVAAVSQRALGDERGEARLAVLVEGRRDRGDLSVQRDREVAASAGG
jgi:hypothetical protein